MKITYSFLVTTILSLSFSFSQNREKDTIDSQTVNVVKPYTPTISDAFKIKDNPSLEDKNTIQKKEVRYNIFSIPVASTFTPAKGKAANVDKRPPAKLYDNYLTGGVGSFTNIMGELYLNHALNNTENVGGYFSHHSSGGGIEGVQLDDSFSKTALNANYSQKLSDFSWKIDLGADLQSYNWYGLPEGVFDQTEINMIDPSISYTGFEVGGNINFEDAIIEGGNVRFRRFGDARDSGENRFLADTRFAIPILDEEIKIGLRVDYLNGNFDRNYITEEGLNYGNTTFGASGYYEMIEDDLTLQLGLNFVYLRDSETEDNEFYIFPNFEASYRLVDDILISYAGIKGDLIQNSFYDITQENPFVSPTVLIAPTDRSYDAYLGLKGRLSNNVSYNIKGRYIADRFKPLFKLNDAQTFAEEDYQYGNSFNLVYDNVKTLSVAGELNIAVNRNFNLRIQGEYFNYSTTNEREAWNLPDITGNVFLDYQISEKWFAGGSLYYMGQRKDEFQLDGTLVDTDPTLITLDAYFDANAHVGYKITDQFSVFAKANNIANNNYQRWANFPVQNFQALAGATYQFDF
ncbi:TonB-dependent receptor [Winogradskyella maritima]|uniref:TonB-dependent receptor n=1 Tax=Winogradskyella maritima TaxID=1517766 RepID=A0ABV8AH64_9FLAO|nr:TonB-dependent receptor [Winogradskyella maritima]